MRSAALRNDACPVRLYRGAGTLTFLSVLAISLPALADPTFVDVTAAAQLTHELPVASTPWGVGFMTGGGAAGDVDGDGWPDLFFTRLGMTDVLYRNNRDGTFEDISTSAGFTEALPTNGAAFGDVDNDGDLDLYLTGTGTSRYYLYLNDGSGNFSEDAAPRNAAVWSDMDVSGSPVLHYGQSVTMGDYDRDGYLDIFTTDYEIDVPYSGSRLLRNRGGAEAGHFDDVTAQVGLDVYRNRHVAYRFTGRFSDLDRDGHTDLLVVSDFETSQLFWNNGDNTFTDGTIDANVGTDQNGMGTAVGDIDGDGDFDWFITAIKATPETPPPYWDTGNRLYLNQGDRTFTDVTDAAGVRDAGWGWGTSLFDSDNDGDLDLIATNGWYPWHQHDPTTLWTNDGNGQFTDVSKAWGITDTRSGRGLLHLDYDKDGDVDIIVVNRRAENEEFSGPILYRNDGGNDNHWLRIRLAGTQSNRDGIGAILTITPDLSDPDHSLVWEIDGGSSFLSQSEFTAHFGLGTFDGAVDQLTVEWPSGLIEHYYDLTPNTELFFVEGATALPGDYNRDGVVDAADFVVWRDHVGAPAGTLPHDVDGVVIGPAQYETWQANFGNTVGRANSTTNTAVPEPTSAWLLMLVAMSLCRRLQPFGERAVRYRLGNGK